jgi:nucleotide-binding universal stress UspA family protein
MTAPDALLGHVLVGVDGSEESFAAVELVAQLEPVAIELVSVWSEDPPPVVVPRGSVLVHEAARARRRAELALTAAEALVPGARTLSVEGYPWQALLRRIRDGGHTLVAVGGRRESRALGMFEASVTTELLHKAPCSVLVARPGSGPIRRIVVGLDGSREAERARAAAALLASRVDAELVELTASEEPVEALVEAAAGADLLVVGSRGLHGLRSLGSVSERVAHRAPCSTLVVR